MRDEHYDAEQAIIEAAQALANGPWSANNPVFWDNFKRLTEAARALAELEVE